MRLVAILSAAAVATLTAMPGGFASRPKPKPIGGLVTYPAPGGTAISRDYSVKVRPLGGAWRGIDVYWVVVDLDTHSNAAMVEFDSGGPVQVSITKKSGTMRFALVRPLSYGIKPRISADGRTAMFTLPRPLNVSFEPDGDRLHNVHVFANPIERNVPRRGPHVIFFGPGFHELPGDHILRVPSDTTVYVAGGAIVKGALSIDHARNVVVRGRGIISEYNAFKPGTTPTVAIDHSSNVGVRDVTILRSRSGGFEITDSEGVVLSNVRELNPDVWSDGVDVYASSDILVDNAFLRTSDDSIAVFASTPYGGQGSTRNVTVRNSSLWADVAHPILVGTFGNPAGGDVIQHVDFQNLDILEHDQFRWGGLYQGAMAVNAGDRVAVRDVRFESVRVDDFSHGQLVNVRVFLNPTYDKEPGTSVDHVLFRNVSYRGHRDSQSRIEGYDASRKVQDVTFENLIYNGATALDAASANIAVGPYVEDILFRKRPSSTTLDDSSDDLQYAGRWQVIRAKGTLGGSVHLTSGSDGRMKFAFSGSEARVYGTTGPDHGKVDVYVDGAYATTVDTYSMVRRPQQIWFDTGVLDAGSHTLELRCRATRDALSSGSTIAFDKLEVVG